MVKGELAASRFLTDGRLQRRSFGEGVGELISEGMTPFVERASEERLVRLVRVDLTDARGFRSRAEHVGNGSPDCGMFLARRGLAI